MKPTHALILQFLPGKDGFLAALFFAPLNRNSANIGEIDDRYQCNCAEKQNFNTLLLNRRLLVHKLLKQDDRGEEQALASNFNEAMALADEIVLEPSQVDNHAKAQQLSGYHLHARVI